MIAVEGASVMTNQASFALHQSSSYPVIRSNRSHDECGKKKSICILI